MPLYDPQHDYPDGSGLSPTGHNGNMYDGSTREQGLYSLLNGALDKDNIASVEDFAIIPGEKTYPEVWIDEKTTTYFDETISSGDSSNYSGCLRGHRWIAPANLTCGMFQWSMSTKQYRVQQFLGAEVGDPTNMRWTIGPSDPTEAFMRLRMYVNGVWIPGASIVFPITVHVSENADGTTSANYYTKYENVRAQHRSGGIVLGPGFSFGGVDMPEIGTGLNTVEFKVFIEAPDGDTYNVPLYRRRTFTGGRTPPFFTSTAFGFDFRQRLTLGHASFSWVGFNY